MKAASKSRLSNTMGGQVVVLTMVMLPCYVLVLLVAWRLQGEDVLGMVTKLAGVCYGATILAIAGEHWFAVRHSALLGLGWAMAFRTGVPLAAALILLFQGGPLAKAWFFCYLGLFYAVALTVHSVLSYRAIK
jgi:hypothetical protein